MGLHFPSYPGDTSDGDERADSPKKTTPSLLGTERGTDYTRRIETDSSRNLYVRVAQDDSVAGLSVTALAAGAVVGITDGSLTTILTYTAPTSKKVSKIQAGGTLYAKFQLFVNTTLIATKRSGPEASDIIDVKVTHYHTGELGDFESTLYGG
jgi:hypothetical protein